VQGTILAVELALQRGFAFHIGGGFHHAHKGKAEGSCLFADAVVAIRSSQAKGLLDWNASLLYIDLDAHRGNGVADLLKNDPQAYGIDIFNYEIYPGPSKEPLPGNWCSIAVESGCDDHKYLSILKSELDNRLRYAPRPKLAIYNAGTDVLNGDVLGRLSLTAEGILRRDITVIDTLIAAGIPVVMLTSGGYTAATPFLIAETAAYMLDRHGSGRSS
jgi:histone deacetylase 11